MALTTKIIPAIFASFLVFPAYLLSYTLSKNYTFSMASATLASITPFFFSTTFNHLSTLTLSVPLLFLLIHLWTQTPKNIGLFLTLAALFAFLTPLSLLFTAALCVYFILCFLDKINLQESEYELGLFTIALTIWTQFILYKKLLITHGLALFWQNIPISLLSQYYTNNNILTTLFSLGILIFPFGIFALYKHAIQQPKKEDALLFSLVILSFVCLSFKIISLTTGLLLLGITFAILSAQTLSAISKYILSTKAKKHTATAVISIIIALFITTIIPTYTLSKEELATTITDEDFQALSFIKYNTNTNAKIIAPASFGHYITGIANRSNIIDTYFLLQPKINERYSDIEKLYTTTSELEALEIFDKYNATHLIVPSYLPNIKFKGPCFLRTDFLNVHLYQRNTQCKIEVVA